MILFAPMQGYTEACLRNAHFSEIGGIEEYYLPFVRLEKGGLRKRDILELDPAVNSGTPVVPQVLVRRIPELETLLDEIQSRGYRRVDFNFSCPFVKVTEHGSGAAMLENSSAVAELLRRACDRKNLSVSVKLRAGMVNSDPLKNILPVLNDFPLKWIVLHPRTAIQQYTGVPDRAAFQNFAEQSVNPVVYNGDLVNSADAAPYENCMIGRGLLADPLLARKIQGLPIADEPELLRRYHAALMKNLAGNDQILPKLKSLWEYFLPGAEKRLRKKIMKSRDLADYQAAVETLFSSL